MEESLMSELNGAKKKGLAVADHMDPLYIHPSDSPGMVLVSKSFEGVGFGTWKRSMLIALSAKNKIGFIDGTLLRPESGSEGYRLWERCNDMVISWILNAVSKEIAESIIYTNSAFEMWQELCTRFGQSNLAQNFSLQKELCLISQGNDSISVYYTRIKRLWDEIASLRNLPACSCTASSAWGKFEQDQKLIQLLMGLNDSFHMVRGNVLMMNPVPTIAQVYSMLLQEEKQQEMRATMQFNTEPSAMNVQNQRSGKLDDANGKKPYVVCNHCKKPGHSVETCWQLGNVPTKRPPLVCTHCKKTGHKVEFCYKIIGYPGDSKSSKDHKEKRVAAQAGGSNDESASVLPGFTADQCNQLLRLLSKGKEQLNNGSDFAGCTMAGPFSEEPSGSW